MDESGYRTLQSLGRRRWLGAMLACGTTLAAGFGLTACEPQPTPGGRRLLALGRDAAHVARALAEAVAPAGAGFPDIGRANVLARLDEELHFVAADVRDDVLAALAIVSWLPFAYGYFARFEGLDLAARRDVVRRAQRSGVEVFRAAASGLRMILLFLYFGDEAAWPAVGYDGPFGHLPPQPGEQRQRYAQLTTDG